MREFRLAYSSPCSTDGFCKTGYVYRRVHVGVPLVSARTGEVMLIPFSNSPTDRASLTRVGRVDVCHGDTQSLDLVGYKILQLPEGPTMQSAPHPLPRTNTIADMGQVFHANFPHMQRPSLLSDSFGNFVVYVFDMPPLPTGENPELAPGSPAPVGLETTAMGKVAVTLVPQLPATKDLATARGGEIVFPNIHPKNATEGGRGGIGNVQYEVKKPLAFTTNKLGFLRFAGGQQISLVLAANKRNQLTTSQGEQRQRAIAQRVSPMVEMDCRPIKGNCGNGFVLNDAFVGFECFVCTGDSVDGVADHLAPESREVLPKRVVRQMVQRHPVPAAMLLYKRHRPVAGLREHGRKTRQFRGLLSRCKQFQGCRPFHIGNCITEKIALQEKGDAGLGQATPAALSLPGMNAGVSRAIG